MKQLLPVLLLLGAMGCVEMTPRLRESTSQKGPAISPAALATPITADQVTEKNARRMAQALWDEFDQEDVTAKSATDETRLKHR
jgi:hypothetical protein